MRLKSLTVSLPMPLSPAFSFQGLALAVAIGLFVFAPLPFIAPSALASEVKTTMVKPSCPTSSTSWREVSKRMMSLGRCSIEPMVWEPAKAALIRWVRGSR